MSSGTVRDSHPPARVEKKWNVRPSEASLGIVNPIRELVERMGKPNPDKKVVSLAQGDPSAYGNLPPNPRFVEAVVACTTSGQGNGYSPSSGVEKARVAVASAHSPPNRPVPPHHVFLTAGCSQGLEKAISSLAFKGCNILLPTPGFPLYETICSFYGVEPRFYSLQGCKRWEANADHIEALADDNTTALLVCNPGNPTGQNYSEQHIRSLVQVADRLRLPIIADEVYADMVFAGETFTSVAEISHTVPVLSIGAVSKRCLVPGWRCGWIVVHDRNNILADANVIEALVRQQMITLGPCGLIQEALPTILHQLKSDKKWTQGVMAELQRSADVTISRIQAIPGLKIISEPQGAMYVLVGISDSTYPGLSDDVVFAQRLMEEESVVVLPGKCFRAPGTFRICFAAPIAMIEEACDRLAEFCQRLSVSPPGTPFAGLSPDHL